MYCNPLDYYTSEEWEAFMQAAAKLPTPHVICKLSIMKREFMDLKERYPNTSIYYAIKSNPGVEALKMLAGLGCNFDCASRPEIEKVLGVGVEPSRISYGNTIKKSEDIAFAYSKGIRLFATDSEMDVLKLAEHAPGANVFARILLPECKTADWPLSKKFGCAPAMSEDLLCLAKEKGLNPVGVSFHVGSQQRDCGAWSVALKTASEVFTHIEERTKNDKEPIHLTLVNTGGGLPGKYIHPTPEKSMYQKEINSSMAKYFGDGENIRPDMKFFMEPGRSLSANCGILVAQIVMVTKKDKDNPDHWVYLDAGVFGGLYECIDEAMKYPLYVVKKDGSAIPLGNNDEDTMTCIIAGPSCDSMDILYQDNKVKLPKSIKEGDRIVFMSAGAYTNSTSFQAFNGFAPTPVTFIE